jgi:isopentenyl-diphosphate Delta-isomerase
MHPTDIGARKDDHLRIALGEDVSAVGITNGLEDYRFVHCALPEIDLEDVNPATDFLGHRLAYPLIIASMTGGTPQSGNLNRILAEAAVEAGIGMGLGSTRAMLENPKVTKTFQVRSYAPDLFLLANLGAVQLNHGYGIDACRRLIDLTEANGLYLHLNPLQEALQPGGDTQFSGLLTHIEALCTALPVPVIVKEVGWGLSTGVARQLIDAGVAALDTAGAGGTSWSEVERYRQDSAVEQEIAASFRGWGIPTATSLVQIRRISADIPLIASGGLTTGIEVAKCLALGADIASLAAVLLRAAATSPEALYERITILCRQLTIAMFVTGSATIADLRAGRLIEFGDYLGPI